MIKGICGNIYLYGEGIKKTSVTLSGGRIEKIGACLEEGFMTLPEKLILIPAFIDEHTHGANGGDSMYADYQAYLKIASAIPREGTASFLFTTMTMSKDKILSALNAINGYIKSPSVGAQPLGVHLEGPFISEKFAGAQNTSDILKPDEKILQEFLTACDKIKLITLTYKPQYKDFLEKIISLGITPSLGHTDCTAAEAKEAIENGIRCATHTFNAMSGIHHRDIGAAGELLLSDNVNCEVICDLKHVSEDAIKLLYKCKGKDRIILITDSMEAKYLPDGKYKLGGNDVYVKGDEARLENGTLAGSVLKMNEAVRNIKNVLGISLEEAVDMATVNPAKNIGIFDAKGGIAAGKDADFAVIDEDINVYKTIANGQIIYGGK